MTREALGRLLAAAAAAATLTLLTHCALVVPQPEQAADFGLDESAARMAVAGLAIDADTSVLVGAGDIARCDALAPAAATARLVEAVVAEAGEALVFTTGDHAYESGTRDEFERCYTPTWGRFEAITRPSPGNHDYETPSAIPYYEYFSYFDDRPHARERGWYSFDFAGWHIVSLNSMLPMSANSAQIAWLEQDLHDADAECILAYWHHPLFSSGRHGINPWDSGRDVQAAWEVLSRYDAELIVNGHEHIYERFEPQNASGEPAAGAPRQITVGTGGGQLQAMIFRRANSATLRSDGYGVLVLTLEPTGYRWAFLGTDGIVHDRADSAVDCREA